MLRFSFTVLIAALISQSVYARSFSAATGGNASFDFNRGELKIPCLSVQGSDSEADGNYFSVVLQQRGNSMNFELALAEPDDSEVCGAMEILANSARSSEPEIHLECQVSENRIRIEVEGEDLPAGDYTAQITNASEVSVSSESQAVFDQEVKFWFDSDDSEAVINFAGEGEEITATLTSNDLTLETQATCTSATQDQDEDSDEDSTDMDDDTVGEATEDEDGEDNADDDQGDTDEDDGIETVTDATVNPGRGNSGNNPGQSGQDNGKSNADKKNGNNGKSNKN